jgi:hypothetical protein
VSPLKFTERGVEAPPLRRFIGGVLNAAIAKVAINSGARGALAKDAANAHELTAGDYGK